jgi:uncharacterized protein YeaO (DUF488 family)
MDYTFIAGMANEISLPEKGILSNVLHKDEYVNITAFGFAAGQELSAHSAPTPAALYFLEGIFSRGRGRSAPRERYGGRAGRLFCLYAAPCLHMAFTQNPPSKCFSFRSKSPPIKPPRNLSSVTHRFCVNSRAVLEEYAMIQLKRVYDPPDSGDGVRFLVERLWPRGVKKSSLAIDTWSKDAAPSVNLRKWFHHDSARWNEFRRRYFAELKENQASWLPLLEAARHGTVTLIYSSHDSERNNAVALKEFLDRRLRLTAV